MPYSKKPRTIKPDEVDPSVYYYDEVYDDMKETEHKLVAKSNSKPKYIEGLKETAKLRGLEKEVRTFKKYARDREMYHENDDVYITKAYKKRLDEIKDLESKIKSSTSEIEPHIDSQSYADIEDDKNEISKDNVKEEKVTRRKLGTIEDRRVYLKDVLSKRTVDEVYEEALQRYILRKSVARKSTIK